MRLLVETLIVAAIIGPAAYFWYSYQVKRTADAMLERAKKLAEEKDDAAAAQYYFQYLKLRPGDADAQVLLAEDVRPRRQGAGGERTERSNTTIRRWEWRRRKTTGPAPTTGRIAAGVGQTGPDDKRKD